jgi:hypothetical protein
MNVNGLNIIHYESIYNIFIKVIKLKILNSPNNNEKYDNLRNKHAYGSPKITPLHCIHILFQFHELMEMHDVTNPSHDMNQMKSL